MKNLQFGKNDSFQKILQSLKESEDSEINLSVEEGSPILSNPTLIEVIKRLGLRWRKKFNFVSLPQFYSPPTEVAPPVIAPPVATPSAALPTVPPTAHAGFVVGKDVAAEKGWHEARETTSFFKRIKLNKILRNKKAVYLGFATLALIVLASLVALLPKAKVTLYVNSKTLEKEVSLAGSGKIENVDLETSTLPLKSLEESLSDTSRAKTTGEKLIGDEAKGRVTVRNYSPLADRTFPAGTKIKPGSIASDLEFTFDSPLTIKAASISAEEGTIVSGKAAVGITAAKIGDEGNLAASTRFTVNNEPLTSVDAVNDLAFSGGLSKKVQVVSSSDQTKLLESLSETLKKKGETQLKSKVIEGLTLLEKSMEFSISNKKFSANVDSEAQELTLTLEAKIAALAYKQDNLKAILEFSLKELIPEGYKIEKLDSKDETFNKKEEGTFEIITKVTIYLTPEVKEAEIVKKIKGKSLGEVKGFLESQENISGYEIKISPSFFAFFQRMPFLSTKVNLEVESK
ncbi:MAG: hypothetical protein A2Y57_04920 [Candidatus Woykebacteria bacterium RBG_13_40_7b]|uniref:Baseplate protein J-like domain-containing protein n=1 Tax=Candidatus Woykebacteria bacterium RBG_13_40_7b TaxID=1802594 RepID=A0A1G1W6H6_9BACT|nr:MAG: hypothetical protein A2Y57_04920 [Candidatus Woykebacteria bacterium RBG_13_40_7b]